VIIFFSLLGKVNHLIEKNNYFCSRIDGLRKTGVNFQPFWDSVSLIRQEAQMAKLVDALVSGTSVSNDVQVRVLFWAPQTTPRW
jgi:hypothetical protein